MYIVEIIDTKNADLYYLTEIFSNLNEAKEYVQEECEGTPRLAGVIISVLLEKSAHDDRMLITSTDVVYHS